MNDQAVCCDLEIRVRYAECDPWGFVHHSRYFEYFEAGRVELLRRMGVSYRDCEAKGVFFVLSSVECKFRSPASFDDVLTLSTTLSRVTRARVDHVYQLKRDGVLLAEAKTTLACVSKQGKIQPIPEWFPTAPS